MTERILVIRLGALGDFVLSFGPFAAIRAHHPLARITLLTTRPFAALARRSPWFDEVWEDGRPSWSDIPAVLRLRRRLRAQRFARVYDLQTSSRSARYRWLVGAGAEWSGHAKGASHRHDTPQRTSQHTLERQREQLAIAGIRHFPAPDLSWLAADTTRFGLPEHFCLLVPGASKPAKRWPADRYGELTAGLGMPAVVLGSAAEVGLAAAIRARAPGAIDLTGRTDFIDIAALGRQAAVAVGNDTGPTHLLAAVGCPTLALFGDGSDPALCAPRGPAVALLRQAPISALEVAEVRAAVSALLPPA